jgi:hypothetical protein
MHISLFRAIKKTIILYIDNDTSDELEQIINDTQQ